MNYHPSNSGLTQSDHQRRDMVIQNDNGRGSADFTSSQRSFHDGEDSSGISFWDILRILLRRKWMIAAITLLGIVASTILTLRAEPLYRASISIEVQREEARIFEGTSIEPVSIADEEYMATQYALLKSRSLAERVVETLGLANDEHYADQTLDRPARLNQASAQILDNLNVSPEGRSRVINLRYISPNRREAARIPNAMVENFIEINLERKYNTTAYARRFLEERLETAKVALEESERQLVEYASQQNILELSDGGSSTSLDANSILSLNNELANAESRRIAAEQKFLEARDNPNSLLIVVNETTERLKERRSVLEGEYQEKLGRFQPQYPEMVQLRSRIDALDREIELERLRAISVLESEYRATVSSEDSLRVRVEELKDSLQDLRNRRIEYTILTREVDTNRSQYEGLLQRLKEISIASGVGSSQVSVVDRAIVPDFPFAPNLPRSIVQSLILSLIAGVGLAFVLNYLDDTIKTPEDSKTKLGLSVIGVVPKVKGVADGLRSALQDPMSGVSEAIYSARTALEFTTKDGAPRSLLVTSTRSEEGKTSTSVALAMAFARSGQSVLVIDADMRKPSFVAEAGSSIGLSGLLTRDSSLRDHIVSSTTKGLSLLPAGTIPPNPAELLSSQRIHDLIREAESMFDLVLIDSPPVLSFADAPILGSICEGTLVVIQSGAIRTPAALHTMGRLMDAKSNLIGTILTKFDAEQAGYDFGYGYYAYGRAAYGYGLESVKQSSSARKKIDIVSEETPEDTLEDITP